MYKGDLGMDGKVRQGEGRRMRFGKFRGIVRNVSENS